MAKKIKNSLFNDETAEQIVEELKKINKPFVHAYVSRLGGPNNSTILLVISESEKKDWPHGILENSNYRRFRIDNDGTVENFTVSGMKKIRKFTAKTVDKIIEKVSQ